MNTSTHLVSAFQLSGGLMAGDTLSELLRTRTDQPISLLARWIVRRQVVNIPIGSINLLPLFQFDLARMDIKPGIPSVIAELSGAFDDTEIAEWFTRPNGWLANQKPVDCFAVDARSVFQAARADRFITRG